jgi:hypothetical protein
MRTRFALVLAAVTGLAALPWVVNTVAGFVDDHRQILGVIVAVGVCLFLAVGAALGGMFDRRSSREAVSPPNPARGRGSRLPTRGPVHTWNRRTRPRTASPFTGGRAAGPRFRKDFWL